MKTEQTPADLQNAPDNVVTLDQPIKRGAQSIESLTLRKPSSGELRGRTCSTCCSSTWLRP